MTTNFGDQRVVVLKAFLKQAQGHLLDSAVRFPEAVSGRGLGSLGCLFKESFFENIQPVFLHPGKLKGSHSAYGCAFALMQGVAQLFETFYGLLVLFPSTRFSFSKSHNYLPDFN